MVQLQGARSRGIIPESEVFHHQKLVGRNEEQFGEFSWEGRGGVNLLFESGGVLVGLVAVSG